jgi:hypothetical protein
MTPNYPNLHNSIISMDTLLMLYLLQGYLKHAALVKKIVQQLKRDGRLPSNGGCPDNQFPLTRRE